MVKGPHHLPYIQRLQRLYLYSLEKRRQRDDLILAFGIFHGSYDLPHDIFFTLPSCSHLRGHDLKLRHRSFHLARRKAAFSVWIVEPWNKLPPSVIDSPSVVHVGTLIAFWSPLSTALKIPGHFLFMWRLQSEGALDGVRPWFHRFSAHCRRFLLL